MAKTRTKKKSSAANLLGNLSKKGASKSKSTTPQINVTNVAQLDAMAAIIDAKNDAKQADSALKIAEGAFRDEATKKFETRCRDDATLHTSVRFMGTRIFEDGETEPVSLQYLQTRRCKKMQEEEASDPLHSAFGPNFDALFNPQRIVEIDTGKLSDEQVENLIEAMQGALGEDFDEAVSVQSLIIPKEAFFGKRILDAKIRVQADNAAADGYAVPFASSFKL